MRKAERGEGGMITVSCDICKEIMSDKEFVKWTLKRKGEIDRVGWLHIKCFEKCTSKKDGKSMAVLFG